MIIDVRSAREYASGHVPGAVHLPFWKILSGHLLPSAARSDGLVVYCEHGPRAWIAKTALRLRGIRGVGLLQGHMRAWRKAGKPLA